MTASGYNLYKKSARDAQCELIERYAPLVKRIAYHLLAHRLLMPTLRDVQKMLIR